MRVRVGRGTVIATGVVVVGSVVMALLVMLVSAYIAGGTLPLAGR